MPPGSKVHSYAAVGVGWVEFFTRPNNAMLGRRWVSPALDLTYDFGRGLFSHDTPAYPTPMAGSSRGASEDESLDRRFRRAACDHDCRGCAEPDSIPQGRLEGNRKNPAVRNDRVPFGVSEGGRRSRPGGYSYRPGSRWASDLGNDIGRKQRRQGAVCLGGHGGQQDHHRCRYRWLLPHHDLVAGPDGEVL